MKKWRGIAYDSGFLIEDEQLKIKIPSKNLNLDKIVQRDKLFCSVSEITSLALGLISIFLLGGLVISSYFLFDIPTSPLASTLFILTGFAIVAIGCYLLILLEKIFCHEIFPYIFSYIECLTNRNIREYHAVEHKVIALLQANFPVTPENLRGASSFAHGCGTIRGFPKFLWFLERLTLSEPSDEKLNEGIEVGIKYYIRAANAIKKKMEEVAATENK